MGDFFMVEFQASVGVHPSGFEWIHKDYPHPLKKRQKCSPVKYLVLRDKEIMAQRHHDDVEGTDELGIEYYDPFEEDPALFRLFAKLEPDEEAICEFANAYGPLDSILNMLWFRGETLIQWTRAIESMREAIAVVDSFNSLSTSRRRRSACWEKVGELIDRYVDDSHVHLQMGELDGAFGFFLEPRTLHDVLRMQLVLSVVESTEYRTCAVCGRPFELSPKSTRSDRLYCSDSCRVRNYQRRRRQAIDLRSKGKSLRVIAHDLQSDLQTVKKWVHNVNPKERKK